MVKGIYTPLSGAVAQEKVLEIIANNLANVNTTSFKGEKVTFTMLEPEPDKHYNSPLPPANYKLDFEDLSSLIGNEIAYVGVADVSKDFSQGPVIQTNNPTDLMIEGPGFFSVHTNEGMRFTRDGTFRLNPDGVLTTQSGDPVMGENGLVYLRSNQFTVNNRGEIYQDGNLVDKLIVYQIENTKAFEKVSNNYYYFGGEESELVKTEHPQVTQGSLEGSNVNPIQNMTAMIVAHRSFEAYQKAIKNYDNMMEKSSNTIGEVRA